MPWQSHSVVYSVDFLNAVRSIGFDPDQELALRAEMYEQFFWYPDGSLEILRENDRPDFDESIAGGWRSEMNARGQENDEDPLWSTCEMDSLSHHDWIHTSIYVYGKWTQAADGRLVTVESERFCPAIPGVLTKEAPAESSLITVEFLKKLSQNHLTGVAKALDSYFAADRASGVWEDGTVQLRGPVSYAAKAIQFTLDTSKCGNRTIVWLVLCLLRLCSAVRVARISFLALDRTTSGCPPFFGNDTWESTLGPFSHSLPIKASNLF